MLVDFSTDMPTPRITMRQLRQTLRLHLEARPEHARVRRALGISKTTVGAIVSMARVAGVDWVLAHTLSDEELQARVYRPAAPRSSRHLEPDFALIHQELPPASRCNCCGRSTPHNPPAYRYTGFCVKYRAWAQGLKRSMRQVHSAGEKLFVDYAGQTVPSSTRPPARSAAAQIFVAVLGASNYTYAGPPARQHCRLDRRAGATPSRSSAACRRCRAGPDPRADQAPHRYEPEPNRTYAELADHYGVAVLPARPRQPRDKAKVEAACRWSSAGSWRGCATGASSPWPSSTRAIAELLVDLNQRPFKKLPGCRRERLRGARRPALRAAAGHALRASRRWKAPGSTSTTTSRSTATTTACRTGWCGTRSRCASPRPRSSASGQSARGRPTPCSAITRRPHHPRRAHAGVAPRTPASGRRPGSSPGAERIGGPPPRVVRWQLETVRIPSRATAPAWACTPGAQYRRRGWRPRAPVRWHPLAAPAQRRPRSCGGLDRQPRRPPRPTSRLPAHENVRGPDYYH